VHYRMPWKKAVALQRLRSFYRLLFLSLEEI